MDPASAAATARTVVLRRVGATNREFELHSDSRAGKIKDLEHYPNACLHFYDPRSRTQLRVTGPIQTLVDGPEVEAIWKQLPEHNRAQYLSFDARHFAVLTLQATHIDWLWLAKDEQGGHQRIEYHWSAVDAQWHSQELPP